MRIFRTAIVLFLFVFASFPLVFADRGLIAVTLGVSIYEPGQKAIVAWNGQQEILILSTDVQASQQTTVLEILPLPSVPTVEAASFQSFQQIQEMIWQEALNDQMFYSQNGARGGSVDIVFHTQIGAHNITVVKATDAASLLEFANSFLSTSGTNQTITLGNYQSAVEDYMSRGFRHYALDIVTFTPEENSITPILYKFDSDTLYYPLLITSPLGGTGKITLFTLTEQKLENHSPLPIAYYQSQNSPWQPIQFTVSRGDLATIDLRLSQLFPEGAWLTVLTYNGSLGFLTKDLMVAALAVTSETTTPTNIVVTLPTTAIALFFLLGAAAALAGAAVAQIFTHLKSNKQS